MSETPNGCGVCGSARGTTIESFLNNLVIRDVLGSREPLRVCLLSEGHKVILAQQHGTSMSTIGNLLCQGKRSRSVRERQVYIVPAAGDPVRLVGFIIGNVETLKPTGRDVSAPGLMT